LLKRKFSGITILLISGQSEGCQEGKNNACLESIKAGFSTLLTRVIKAEE
jgi:hypothetical protein